MLGSARTVWGGMPECGFQAVREPSGVAIMLEANLGGANLRRTYLTGVALTEADLSRADLSAAALTEAALGRAVLRRAKVTSEQLDSARSLEGATMPDGSAHD